MEWFRTWMLGVTATALILALLHVLVPKGTIRTIAQFTGGLIFILVILRPLLQIDLGQWKWQYQAYTEEINEQIQTYQQEQQEEIRTIIEERTAAYISDKGLTWGIRCHPVVTTYLQDNVPYPDEVTLDTAWNEALSRYMTEELGIPAEKQHWQGSN